MHKRRQVGFQSGRDFQLQEKKHVHVHFSQQVDDSGKLKTGVQITRQQNQEIGKYHGVFHRAASIQHHITGDVPKIFPDNTVVSAAKNAMKFTGHTVLAAENAVIRRKDPAHADNRHWHLQFQRMQDSTGNQHTQVHFIRKENENLGNTHGLFHRAASLQHRITGDTPKIFSDSAAVSAAKNAMKFTGHTILAAENAVLRRTRPEYADNRHWHLQFQRNADSSGKLHTQARFVRIENPTVGEYHGVLHRINSMHHRITGDTPTILPDSVAFQTAKKALRFTGHTALAVENAFIRRFDAGHADNRHWQLQLKRTQDQNGGFHTKMHFVRTDVPQLQKSRGVIHKAVSFRHRISGDIPSLTKHLQSQQPKTKKAIVAKAAAQGAWADVKLTAKAGINTALAAETTALTIKDIGWCEVKRKIAYKYQRDVSNVDDANHGLLASGKIVKDAVVGFQRFQRQKVTLKQERQRLVQKKQHTMLLAEKTNQSLQKSVHRQIEKKAEFISRKKDFRISKKNGTVTPLQKTALKRRKQVYRFEKKKYQKFKRTTYRIQKKETKAYFLQKKIVKFSKPKPLIFMPISYAGARAKSSSWQKAVSADADNDFMRLADAGVRTARRFQKSPAQKTKKAQKNQKSLQKKSSQTQVKLKQQESKLKQSSSKQQQRKKKANHKKRTKKKSSLKERFRRGFHKGIEEAAKKFMIPALPVLFGGLIFLVILVLIFGVFANSGFIMGTYAALDDSLSKSEMVYTNFANNMNKKVLAVGNESLWKIGLNQLGVSLEITENYDDTPTEFIFGQSAVFPDTPAYDFNPNQLWSFLCAYYYDFDASEKAKDNEEDFDVPYWEYDSDTYKIIKKLFELEYTFDYRYDNASSWSELGTYTYDWKFHYVTGSGTENGYPYIDFKAIPNDLKDFAKVKSNRIYYNAENGEILNARKKYKATGWYLQDQRYNVIDPSGNELPSFYTQDTNAFQYDYSYTGGYGRFYTFERSTYWIPSSKKTSNPAFCPTVVPYDVAFFKLNNSTDVSIKNGFSGYLGYKSAMENKNLITDDWNRHYAYNSWAKLNAEAGGFLGYGFCTYYQKYEWVKNCTLYYTVHQNYTFDEAIRKILSEQSDAADRIAYYELLCGSGSTGSTTNLLGNHQTFPSPVDGGIVDLISGNWIYNGYGYDMHGWNQEHCSINQHNGLDIIRNSGSNVYAMVSGKITDYDPDTHSLTIVSSKKVDLWYDKERKVKILYSNVKLKSGLNNGDVLSAGEKIGTSTSDRNCVTTKNEKAVYDYVHVQVYISYDWNSYEMADPRLLINY